MAKRKRQPPMRTHAQWLQIAHWAEANGDSHQEAREGLRAVMKYGIHRDFARLLTDKEILALPAPKAFPWLKD